MAARHRAAKETNVSLSAYVVGVLHVYAGLSELNMLHILVYGPP